MRNLLEFARESEIETEAHDVQATIGDTLRLAANQIKSSNARAEGAGLGIPELQAVAADRRRRQGDASARHF